MSDTWDIAKLEKMITDGVEESLSLEYKGAGALDRSDKPKREITKDVSSMANAAGGTIIYGIAEHQDEGYKHLPERLDPIDDTKFSKEWLESIIEGIRPRIEGLVVIPIRTSGPPSGVIYVVIVPQSNTAHQATDHKYYKRHNFSSIAMDDYEVRDVMSRGTSPIIQLSFAIRNTGGHAYTGGPEAPLKADLEVTARNIGKVYAMYVNAFIYIPTVLEFEYFYKQLEPQLIRGIQYYSHYEDNTVRDVVDVKSNAPYGSIKKYGPSRYDPILPGRRTTWTFDIKPPPYGADVSDLSLLWLVHADNAPERSGKIRLGDVIIEDE